MKKEMLEELKKIKQTQQDKVKDQSFGNLSTKEKEGLLETVCNMLGLIK